MREIMSHEIETGIEGIAVSLYERVEKEIEKIIKAQLEKLGFSFVVPVGTQKTHWPQVDGLERYLFPNDPHVLAVYKYKGVSILGVRINDNSMGIEFDIPNLEAQKKGEAQDEG